MRVRVASHRFSDVILERDYQAEWAEILTAITTLRTPVSRSGISIWSRLRAELVDALTRRGWRPDLPVPAWHRAQHSGELLHVDLEKRGVMVVVANPGRDLFRDLFVLNVAGTGRDAEVGVYVVASAALIEADGDPIPTLEDVALPLSYRLGGMLPMAIVGIEPPLGAPSVSCRAAT